MIQITMPRLSDTMEDGAISVWRKQPGDPVAVGDILVEIETDKATMEYEAYEAGTLSKILVAEGENVSIGTPIALLEPETAAPEVSAQAPFVLAAPDSTSIAGAPPIEETAIPRTVPAARNAAFDLQEAVERRFASPLVRKLAREHNLDLSRVNGSGPGGRIIRADIEHLLDVDSSAPSTLGSAKSSVKTEPDARRDSEEIPMSQTRRVIARRLSESAHTVPHFMVTAAADVEALMVLRADLNRQLATADRPKVSVNDLVVRACALALRAHPLVNASYQDDAPATMLVHHRVNVGVAIASENGLVVPVIEDADQKTVSELATETKELVRLANSKRLTPAQMSGGTFSVSNLGMFGVRQFTAIINPPEAAILAVGGVKREPAVVDDDVVARYTMRYTLSADHRIIDGALAAQFLQTLTNLLENPITILA